MKKVIISAAIAIAALVSCQKEIATDEVAVKPGYVELTLTAQSDADTKSSLQNGKEVIWEVGEKVAVFTSASEAPEEFTVMSVEGTNVKIWGSVPEGATSFVAAYPFESAVSWDKSAVVKMNVGNQAVTASQNVDPKALASVAYFADASATPTFKNTLALLKFTVGVDGVKKVRISTESAGALAGEVSVTVSPDDAPVAAGAKTAAVEVACEEGFTKDAAYYAAVAPGAYTGFSVRTYVDSNAKLLYTAAAGEIKRNDVLVLGDIATGAKVMDMVFEITNAEDLALFQKNADKYKADEVVKIANDIDLAGVTLTSAESFAGTLDGQGHSLKNWTSNGVSLFKTCAGTLKDFTIDASCKLTFPQTPAHFAFVASNFTGTASGIVNNADASGSGMTLGAVRLAVLFGIANAPTTSDSIVIENCANNGKVTIGVTSHTGTTYVGTVVGSMGNSTTNYLRDCSNTGDITLTQEGSSASNYYFGGVAGGTTNGSNNIRVKNSGNVTLKAGGMEAALCLAGISSYTTGLIEDCENTGAITFESDASLKATFVSGIAGYFASNTMTGSVNRGAITVKAARINGRNGIGDINKKTYNGSEAITAGLSIGGLVSATGRNPVFENSDNYGAVSLTLTNPTASDGTHTAARPSMGGLVGDCAGPMTGCNNYGDVTVHLGNGTAFTAKNAGYTLYVGGIAGSSYNFSGPTTSGGTDNNSLNKFTLENCNNSGDVSVYTDNEHTTNHAVGGIVGWPQSEDKTAVYVAKNCTNSGDITFEGRAKVRIGGIHGGTGRMDGCKNTGKITFVSGQSGSVAASVAAFHSQAHTFSNCVAEGSVEAKAPLTALGGLVANLGNVAFTGMDGCSVNCTLIGGPVGKTGLVVGLFNGTTKAITLGSEEDPIEMKGTVNGVKVTSDNYASYIYGATNYTEGTHKVYVNYAKSLSLEKVWGHHGVAGVAGWAEYVSGCEGKLDTYTRSAAFDDDFVYVPKFSTEAAGGDFVEASIYKFKVSDGSFAGLVQRTTDPDYMAGTWASTVPVSCVRVMKNTDPAVNGGKDILVATNLCDAQNVRAYAWENGVDQQPKLIANFSNARRMGDRISVSGTYQSGRIWYRQSLSASMTAWLSVTNGTTPSYGFDALGAMPLGDAESMGEYQDFGKFGLVSTNSGVGLHLVNGLEEVKVYPSLKRCYGWSPFEFNGKNYLAFLHMAGGTNMPIVTVLEGESDTVSHLQATLDNYNVVLQGSIASADPTNLSATTAYATNNQGDCSVRIIDGVPYIMGFARGGLAVFKVVMK